MPAKLLDVVIKLLVASLAVGFVLALVEINPWTYLGPLGGLSQSSIALGAQLFSWAWTYVILGAAVVVPIWLIHVLLTYLRRR
jgi:hypothetical protein